MIDLHYSGMYVKAQKRERKRESERKGKKKMYESVNYLFDVCCWINTSQYCSLTYRVSFLLTALKYDNKSICRLFTILKTEDEATTTK